MEQVREIVAYHTSKPDGGWSYVWNNAPFFSKQGTHQQPKWLTDGYYFWTDSEHFAHRWGESALAGSYAISRCTVTIEPSKLLDLVGNVEDQLYFEGLLNKVAARYRRVNRALTEVTVPAIIQWARDKNLFPFAAVKAVDNPNGSNSVPYTQRLCAEQLMIPTRQQLCVFEGFEANINNETLIYPEEFKDAVENVRKLQGSMEHESAGSKSFA